MVCISLLFFTGCPETWLKEIGGSPYVDSVFGIVRDSATGQGINEVNVGLTYAEDAIDFVDQETLLIAKCSRRDLTRYNSEFDNGSDSDGNGYYNFTRVDINADATYLIFWKQGYVAQQVETQLVKFADTYQGVIYLIQQ